MLYVMHRVLFGQELFIADPLLCLLFWLNESALAVYLPLPALQMQYMYQLVKPD